MDDYADDLQNVFSNDVVEYGNDAPTSDPKRRALG
jgi:hypothetical protein